MLQNGIEARVENGVNLGKNKENDDGQRNGPWIQRKKQDDLPAYATKLDVGRYDVLDRIVELVCSMMGI
jgi:hypothetical protein